MASVASFHVRLLTYAPQIELTSNFRSNWSHPRLVLTACATNDEAISANQDESSAAPKETILPSKVSLSLSRSSTVAKLREIVSGAPSYVLAVRRQPGADFLLGFLVSTACLIVAARMYVAKKLNSYDRLGSVDDLVRRGQLRSDRRGISQPQKYDDPFNNPLVKVGLGNSSVEMCGKVYKLAPVTLTDEQRTIHQKRRSRAYEWKRPKVFLKEGDDVPPDVDPETIRWIPANHPFATTVSDMDEDRVQSNVYQKHGVPFRIQAEHEAMQKKLETLQSEQKLDKVYIDPRHAKDFERALKAQTRSREQSHPGQVPPQTGQATDGKPTAKPDEQENTD